jgi:hypothetical protein
MNGIFLAASCLGALVTIAMAEPKMQELRHQEQLPQEQSGLSQPMHVAQLTTAKLPPVSADIPKGSGSMTTRTTIDVDSSTGEQTVTEERVIAFQD